MGTGAFSFRVFAEFGFGVQEGMVDPSTQHVPFSFGSYDVLTGSSQEQDVARQVVRWFFRTRGEIEEELQHIYDLRQRLLNEREDVLLAQKKNIGPEAGKLLRRQAPQVTRAMLDRYWTHRLKMKEVFWFLEPEDPWTPQRLGLLIKQMFDHEFKDVAAKRKRRTEGNREEFLEKQRQREEQQQREWEAQRFDHYAGHEDYQDYLMSEHWLRKREAAREYYGDSCCFCNDRNNLQVHHRHYRTLGREAMTDLSVLCDDCHGHHHTRKKLTPEPRHSGVR